MVFKPALLCLWLACLMGHAWPQAISIGQNRFEGRWLIRSGQVYVLLEPFTKALGAWIQQAGEGYLAALQEVPATSIHDIPQATVMVGEQSLPLVYDGGEVFVAAEAYSLALGFRARRNAGGMLCIELKEQLPSNISKVIPGNPEKYFVTQYPSRYNPWGTRDNANCGPACMAMVALAYAVTPPGLLPGDRQGLILWCRQAMTLGNQDQSRGTTCREIQRVSRLLGLRARLLRRFQELDSALANGEIVVVAGDAGKVGWGAGGHFLLCIQRSDLAYVINDPGGFFPVAGTRLPADIMEKFFSEGIALSCDASK